MSAATLALLGATALLMVLSGQRAQRLARQEMDFVAAVSHELRTPLTAIRSAGQSLADGVVDDPRRVREYGALVEREGRRLTEMVAQVLTFAGIQSGQQSLRMEPVSVVELVDAALADCRWVLEENRFEVERSLAANLPPVHGDAAALRQVVANLADNSVKYGARARWVGVSATTESAAQEVVITVADRGDGIRKADLPNLFEPLFRSAAAASG